MLAFAVVIGYLVLYMQIKYSRPEHAKSFNKKFLEDNLLPEEPSGPTERPTSRDSEYARNQTIKSARLILEEQTKQIFMACAKMKHISSINDPLYDSNDSNGTLSE